MAVLALIVVQIRIYGEVVVQFIAVLVVVQLEMAELAVDSARLVAPLPFFSLLSCVLSLSHSLTLSQPTAPPN
jgi:hypothetical protein